MTRIAVVGCGYVADLYMESLRRYPELEVLGVFDRDESRAMHRSADRRAARSRSHFAASWSLYQTAGRRMA